MVAQLALVSSVVVRNCAPNSDLFDHSDGLEMLQFTETENDAPRAVSVLEGGHGLPVSDGSASTMSP